MGNFLCFRLFFLRKREDDVEVFDVEDIDFENVKERLDDGKSIFITRIP